MAASAAVLDPSGLKFAPRRGRVGAGGMAAAMAAAEARAGVLIVRGRNCRRRLRGVREHSPVLEGGWARSSPAQS